MEKLQETLTAQGYKKVKFRITRTNHLMLRGTINGVRGHFILDTGASNSCVDFGIVDHFKLVARDSNTMAAGAGAVGMATQVSRRNKLKLGRWKFNELEIVVFDLSHVNTALEQHQAKAVQGILGADVLIRGEAVIDYASKLLFLKP